MKLFLDLPLELEQPVSALPAQFRSPLEAPLLDSEQLGKFLNLGTDKAGSHKAAVNERYYSGHPMPPEIQLPGAKGRLWYLPTVILWLHGYQQSRLADDVQQSQDVQSPQEPQPKRRRGRPRKIDQIGMATVDGPSARQ
jgi:hypothetical protein